MDNFKHKVICKVHYYDTRNKRELTNDKIKTPIIKNQSDAVALKCKIPEVETFSSRIGQDIINDTLRKKCISNISKAKTQALNKWIDSMNNADMNLLLEFKIKTTDLYLLI